MNQTESVLQSVFSEALEMTDAAARAAFLDTACKGDTALRARVERLLALEPHAGNFMPEAGALDPFSEKIGSLVGRYRLVECIGRGGYGVVYLAEQEEPVRRQVALKIIKLGMDTSAVVARFETERQALAVMNHPNIARAYDAGATETGRPFFVMEFVRGLPITDYCEQNELTIHQRLELFSQVCHGIQHAHQKGIIHRDLKPSNIFVTEHDGVPVPKVIDFGIAKATEESDSGVNVTAGHEFIGTPAYMSPEQVQSGSRDIDTRSDIYSLGIILYELLAEQPPFDPRELMRAGIEEMCRIIREAEPTRPSVAIAKGFDSLTSTASRQRCTAVRGDLDWIVMKCLEKDRARRYESASSLAADIRRHLDHETIAARPPTALYRFQKTVRRHRVGFAAATAIALVLVAAVIVSSQLAIRARRAEAETRKRSVAEMEARDSADAVTLSLLNVLGRGADGGKAALLKRLNEQVQELERPPFNEARGMEIAYAAGRAYYHLEQFREAAPLLEKYRNYLVTNSGPDDPRALKVTGLLAYCYRVEGRLEEARALREDELRRRRRLFGAKDRLTQLAIFDLGLVCLDSGKTNEAIELLDEVLRLNAGATTEDTESTKDILARTYQNLGRHDEALALRKDLLAYHARTCRPEDACMKRAREDLASACVAGGRIDEAAQQWAETSLHNRNDRIHDIKIAALLVWFGKNAEHAMMTERLLKATAATTNAGDANCVAKLASVRPFSNSEIGEAAVALASRAVQLGQKDRLLPWFQLSLGMAEFRRGRHAAADEALLAADTGAERSSQSHRSFIQGTARFYRAMSLFQQGNKTEGKQLFTEAAAAMKSLPPDERNPLAGGARQDDLVLWLSYKEARALLGANTQ